jgi:hypothetical protein
MADTFEIIGPIREIRTIAKGRSVLSRATLVREYGSGRWRKMKGVCLIRYSAGRICEAEVHWYEAHGRGKFDFKVKDELS